MIRIGFLNGLLAAGGLLSAALLAGPDARADIVYLKNGKTIEGSAEVRDDEVIIRMERGSMTVPRADVERIESREPSWEVYEAKARALKPDDIAGHLALAQWCQANNLRQRMEKELQAVLATDPANETAHKLLGHEQVDGKWMSPEDAHRARGETLVEGRWLPAKEYQEHQARKEAAERTKAAIEAEKAFLSALADKDLDKVAEARKHFADQGAAGTNNLLWGACSMPEPAVRLAAIKLLNSLGSLEGRISQTLAVRLPQETDTACFNEICRGIKERKDEPALTMLVYLAAVENAGRRRAALALRNINDYRAFRALIACVEMQPKNTLPGQMGMSLTSFNQTRVGKNGTVSQSVTDGGEVVPAADSLEYISGREYRNDVAKWVGWLGELERTPGGSVIDPGKGK